MANSGDPDQMLHSVASDLSTLFAKALSSADILKYFLLSLLRENDLTFYVL